MRNQQEHAEGLQFMALCENVSKFATIISEEAKFQIYTEN